MATAEPAAPKSLIHKCENSAERAQWEEAFDWLATSMRSKARSGGKWHGKRLLAAIQKTYSAVVLDKTEAKWLVDWIGHLCTYKQKLRSGDKYSPRVNILEALGVANADDVLLDDIEALDHPKSALAEMAPSTASDRYANIPEANMVGPETETSARHSRAAVVPISSIEELPSTPRDIPFSFTKLEHTKGKDFWRAYWKSNTLDEIIANGRAFVLDLEAIKEARNLGAEASAFLDQTMLKLGITLS